MTTFTLNRNFIPNDFLFVAASDRACADLMDSMDRQFPMAVDTGKSLSRTLKRIFFGK